MLLFFKAGLHISHFKYHFTFFIFIAILLWPVASLFSQEQSNIDTVLILKTVDVNAQKIRQETTGQRTENWDKNDLQNQEASHLGQLLSMESGVFVKSYGLGSSATTSMRGGSAGHTQVIWNGLPVQNPMLGQLDFSLIPIGFVDDVSVAYGGNTASWGSGAISGTVFLENKPIDNEGVSASVRSELGSFGRFDQQVKMGFGEGKVRSVIRYFHQEAENDFSYELTPDMPERKQTNAAIKQDGLLHEFYWKPKQNQELSTQVWWQETYREIPPRMVQARSEAKQSDRFIRSAIRWKKWGEKKVLSLRGGLFREKQGYVDPLAGLDTENNFWKGLVEVGQEWHISQKQKLQIGLNHHWLQSNAGAYGQPRQQNRTAAFALFRQRFGVWESQLNIRQELMDGGLVPIVPVVGLEGQVLDWLKVKGKVSRNYRLPTLNDLYWQPGGNPDLKPEQGWSEEVGMEILKEKDHRIYKYEFTFFNRNISDWVQWAIVDGQSFYSPHNITKVWSGGIEQRIQVNWQLNKTNVRLKGGYDYIRSTYQEAVENPKFDKGEQLAYTPEHQWFGGLRIENENWSIAYQHRYTGRVGTLTFSELDNYHIGSLYLNYKFKTPVFQSRLFFHLENIWDTKYQVIEYRAMPGRYFRFGTSISFNKQ